MPMIEMAQSTDVNTIRDLSIATFAETFASLNTEEDMEQYNERHFSTDELQREIDNPDSTFYGGESGRRSCRIHESECR